jgi:cystathionine beta-lyase/cystathionine gamma-synthase
MPKTAKRRLATTLIHAGELKPRVLGAISMPVFQSSTYEFGGGAPWKDVRYIRDNNTPNHDVLHKKLAALEGAEAALVTGSGMAAISTALLAALKAGDHLLIQETVYGGTHGFVTKDLPELGVTHAFVDPDRPQSWKQALRPNTKAFYVETLSNPLLQLGDLEAVPRFCREHGLVSMIDNTFASPVNFRPCERGFDLSLHSGTKYLNGHTDIVCGAIIGRKELVGRAWHKLLHLGGTLDPHACFLLGRGLKTLELRVTRQNQTALALAKFLEGHRAVSKVNYAGLRGHPRHARARKLLDGFGGVLSFELTGGLKAAERLLRAVELPAVAPSLGGVETLITRPATTSHAALSAAERARLGVSDGLVRVAVGLEAAEDLIADFDQALA